jgi:arsenate reductase
MSITLYGIKNCDTVKKARAWLDGRRIAYAFHDYKSDGIDDARLRRWTGELGWERLFNRSGTTFRKLPDAGKEGIDEAKAIGLMLDQPSMIRRPVIEANGELLVGFDPDRYVAAFMR